MNDSASDSSTISDQIDRHRRLRTRALLAREHELSHWLAGSHAPSEGAYLESLARSQLREVLPVGVRVSTGFIYGVVDESDTVVERRWTTHRSPQYDIIVWDAHQHPPLFERDEVVVVVPESVLAVCEFTRTLTPKKLKLDMAKLDRIHLFTDPARLSFAPLTYVVGWSSAMDVRDALKRMEEYCYLDSELPPALRTRLYGGDPGGVPRGHTSGVVALSSPPGRNMRARTGWMVSAHLSQPSDFRLPQQVLLRGRQEEPPLGDAHSSDRNSAWWGMIEESIMQAALRRRRAPNQAPDEAILRPGKSRSPVTAHVFLGDERLDAWLHNFHTARDYERAVTTPGAARPALGENASMFTAWNLLESGPPPYHPSSPVLAPAHARYKLNRAIERLDEAFTCAGAYKDGERTGRWRVTMQLGRRFWSEWVTFKNGRCSVIQPSDLKSADAARLLTIEELREAIREQATSTFPKTVESTPP